MSMWFLSLAWQCTEANHLNLCTGFCCLVALGGGTLCLCYNFWPTILCMCLPHNFLHVFVKAAPAKKLMSLGPYFRCFSWFLFPTKRVFCLGNDLTGLRCFELSAYPSLYLSEDLNNIKYYNLSELSRYPENNLVVSFKLNTFYLITFFNFNYVAILRFKFFLSHL